MRPREESGRPPALLCPEAAVNPCQREDLLSVPWRVGEKEPQPPPSYPLSVCLSFCLSVSVSLSHTHTHIWGLSERKFPSSPF